MIYNLNYLLVIIIYRIIELILLIDTIHFSRTHVTNLTFVAKPPPLCLSWFMKCLEEKLLIQEKFVDSSGLPPPVDLYFTVLGVGFSGATILGIKVFGEELRSRSSFNWLRRFWLVEDEEFGCDEEEARVNKGDVGTGKGFSLQQTESDEF